jgi:hypothetical protein
MSSDDGQHPFRALLVAIKEVLGDLQQGRAGGKEFTPDDFGAELPPQHLNRVELEVVGEPVE